MQKARLTADSDSVAAQTREAQLQALGAAVADYEREHGEISDQEIVALQRADRARRAGSDLTGTL